MREKMLIFLVGMFFIPFLTSCQEKGLKLQDAEMQSEILSLVHEMDSCDCATISLGTDHDGDEFIATWDSQNQILFLGYEIMVGLSMKEDNSMLEGIDIPEGVEVSVNVMEVEYENIGIYFQIRKGDVYFLDKESKTFWEGQGELEPSNPPETTRM